MKFEPIHRGANCMKRVFDMLAAPGSQSLWRFVHS
jgi:hypothetical protein